MPDIPSGAFNLQPNFPIASVIQAAQENARTQQQAKEFGTQQLNQGLQTIGAVGQSLLARRQSMAQALAASKMYAQTPEGQQMMGTNAVASGPNGQVVTPNQTAAGGSGMAPTPNQSPVNMGTLQTAFMGDKPSDMLNQLFERSKQRQQLAIEQGTQAIEGRKQALAETVEPQRLALEKQNNDLLAGIKQQMAGTEAAKAKSQDIDTLLQRKAELTKALPTSWFGGHNNDQAMAAQQEIAGIDAALAAKGYKGVASAAVPQKTANGTMYTVNP